MPTQTTLTVPQPCHESWATMTPTTKGRHCASCEKVVLDFTQKTDAEILVALQRVAAPCGRFRADQLGRPLLPPPVPAPRWQTWLAATAVVMGLREASALAGHAQFSVPTERVITLGMVAVPRRTEPLPAGLPPVIVRGVVLDSVTHEPLPGVTVLLEHTTIGVSTADNGTFELTLPASLSPASAAETRIAVSVIGYETQHLVLDSLLEHSNTIVLVPSSRQLIGELVVTCVAPKHWPWHPQALWQRLRGVFRK